MEKSRPGSLSPENPNGRDGGIGAFFGRLLSRRGCRLRMLGLLLARRDRRMSLFVASPIVLRPSTIAWSC